MSLARHVLPGWRRVSEACSIAVRRRLPVVRGVTSRLAVHRHPLPIGRVGLLREENRNGTGWRRQLHLRTDPRFSEIAERGKVRAGQPGGDRFTGPRLRVPAQGSPCGGLRPRREVPGRLGQRRGHRSARAEDRRRRRLHHRSLGFGREVVQPGRQTPAGTRPARRAFGHRMHRVSLARATCGGAVQSSHRDDGPPQRRHLRDGRLSQFACAPLHARRPAGHVMGHAGQGRG